MIGLPLVDQLERPEDQTHNNKKERERGKKNEKEDDSKNEKKKKTAKKMIKKTTKKKIERKFKKAVLKDNSKMKLKKNEQRKRGRDTTKAERKLQHWKIKQKMREKQTSFSVCKEKESKSYQLCRSGTKVETDWFFLG